MAGEAARIASMIQKREQLDLTASEPNAGECCATVHWCSMHHSAVAAWRLVWWLIAHRVVGC